MENAGKKPMSDAERLELAAKLDEDLDNFINGLEKRQYTEGWPEDRWQEEMEKHPFFMKKLPEAGDELHPLMQGLQQLKYDPNENSPEELAQSYKEDGNFNFKHKNYRLAIIAYTEAIKVKCGNSEVEATLHNNRSAAHWFLKNYRSSLRDAELALQLRPDYDKAALRAAHCCYETGQHEKAVGLCDALLEKKPKDADTLDLRKKSVNALKIRERDARKRRVRTEKQVKADEELLVEVRRRGVHILGGPDGLKLEHLEPHVPELAGHRVFVNDAGNLVWPVIFMYPEYRMMDFLQRFPEDETIGDHVRVVLEERPTWDLDGKYRPGQVDVYFENRQKSKLYAVDVGQKLSEVLKLKEFVVQGGTPSFILVVRNSPAAKSFLKQYGFS